MDLTYENLTFNLAAPFVSHKAITSTQVNHILVQLNWQGLTGYGVAVPAKEYGMLDKTVRAALDHYIPLLKGATPFQLQQLLNYLEKTLPGQPAALAAIDMATHDLLGKIAGLPLYRLLGLEGLALPCTSLSLGLMSLDEVTKKVEQYAAWPVLKLKMSKPDYELVKHIREIYAGRIWIDGNGAWNAKQAVSAAEQFHRYGVELIEQPVPPGSLAALRFVRERAPMTIIADEDCVTPADVIKLADCADGINIKLLKCGGIQRALTMIQLARQFNLKVMLGCKTESVLGITAIAHLAGLADFIDVDGHLDIIDDPFTGLMVDNGQINLPFAAGLGVVRRAV